jgi:hypothetical protein
MRPFQYLDHPSLMDILSYVTQRYTKMFSGNVVTSDFLACRELLILLQSEVEERRKKNQQHYTQPGLPKDNTSI